MGFPSTEIRVHENGPPWRRAVPASCATRRKVLDRNRTARETSAVGQPQISFANVCSARVRPTQIAARGLPVHLPPALQHDRLDESHELLLRTDGSENCASPRGKTH